MESGSLVFSIVVPVYNRPEEIDELLSSLQQQSFKNFEIVIVEDGSSRDCKAVVDRYTSTLSIQYLVKPNSGPGPSRNVGFAAARGDYFVVFDSDCIIPPEYLTIVHRSLMTEKWDAWGGPDKAHGSFTLMQKAMGYTMASVLTTGGIRGGKKHVGWFQPRSFNMGLSRKTFEITGGFQFDRFAEDIELSIRMKQAGLKVGLIPEAFVYHKRRTDFVQFFRQVFNFGKGRALIGKKFPAEVKLTHWFPFFFTVCLVALFIALLIMPGLFIIGCFMLGVYVLAILIHGAVSYKSLMVGLLAVPAAFIQLTGYGLGFFTEKLK
jgi:glycosyltransferase involved in cell wall biosynthesis